MQSKTGNYLVLAVTSLLGLQPVFASGPRPMSRSVFSSPSKVEDFSLYSIGTIDAKNSDVHGSIGSGNSISLYNYKIFGLDRNSVVLSAAQNLNLSHMSIDISQDDLTIFPRRGIEAKGSIDIQNAKFNTNIVAGRDLSIYKATVAGQIYGSSISNNLATHLGLANRTFAVDHQLLANDLNQKSSQMAHLPNAIPVNVTTHSEIIKLATKGPRSVFTISAENLDRKTVSIVGNQNTQVIINLTGTNISMKHFAVQLAGVLPQNIKWNFPNADTLNIQNTAEGLYGLPGRFYAPNAIVKFLNGRITGGLYIGALIFDEKFLYEANSTEPDQVNPQTGQIDNFPPPQGTGPLN